ncbi:MAG: hypothetical protein COA44_08570 [Arcobacter sp.]|nr:MAG: hypothetical protein COA44_08570 [Arcobacter sp.]
MTLKEYIFIFISWAVLLVFYSMFLWDISGLHELFIISFVSTVVLKSIYDVVYKTGAKNMYIYDDRKNQNLRYLVVIISTFVTIFYHYIYFCIQLKVLSCGGA